jgi:hypothetical protein
MHFGWRYVSVSWRGDEREDRWAKAVSDRIFQSQRSKSISKPHVYRSSKAKHRALHSGERTLTAPMILSSTLTEHFTQTDPLQAAVGQAYPSTYIYANNNPNMYVDPSGKRGCTFTLTDPMACPPASRNPIRAAGKLIKAEVVPKPTRPFNRVGSCAGASAALVLGGEVSLCEVSLTVRTGPVNLQGRYYGSTISVGVGEGVELAIGGGQLWSDVRALTDLGGESTCVSLTYGLASGEYCWWSGGRSFLGAVGPGVNLATALKTGFLNRKGLGFHAYQIFTRTRISKIEEVAPSFCDFNRTSPSCGTGRDIV